MSETKSEGMRSPLRDLSNSPSEQSPAGWTGWVDEEVLCCAYFWARFIA